MWPVQSVPKTSGILDWDRTSSFGNLGDCENPTFLLPLDLQTKRQQNVDFLESLFNYQSTKFSISSRATEFIIHSGQTARSGMDEATERSFNYLSPPPPSRSRKRNGRTKCGWKSAVAESGLIKKRRRHDGRTDGLQFKKQTVSYRERKNKVRPQSFLWNAKIM